MFTSPESIITTPTTPIASTQKETLFVAAKILKLSDSSSDTSKTLTLTATIVSSSTPSTSTLAASTSSSLSSTTTTSTTLITRSTSIMPTKNSIDSCPQVLLYDDFNFCEAMRSNAHLAIGYDSGDPGVYDPESLAGNDGQNFVNEVGNDNQRGSFVNYNEYNKNNNNNDYKDNYFNDYKRMDNNKYIIHKNDDSNGLDHISMSSSIQEILPYYAKSMYSDDQLTKASNSLDEMIIECAYDRKACNKERDFVLVKSERFGTCYVFNLSGEKYSTRPGRDSGFIITMQTNQTDYLSFTQSAGMMVEVHKPLTSDFITEQGFTIPLGRHLGLNLKSTFFDLVDRPAAPCVQGNKNSTNYYYYGKYTELGCLKSRRQDLIMKQCLCKDPTLAGPADESIPRCTPAHTKCVSYVVNMMGSMNTPEFAHCTRPCQDVSYSFVSSNAYWPTGAIEGWEGVQTFCKSNEACGTKAYRFNSAKMDIYFESVVCLLIEDTLLFNFSRLLGQIGGLFGLAMGVSIISVAEIFFIIVGCFQK